MNAKERKELLRKEDDYLFSSELKLNKNNLDDMLRQVREKQRTQFFDFFALDVDMDTMH